MADVVVKGPTNIDNDELAAMENEHASAEEREEEVAKQPTPIVVFGPGFGRPPPPVPASKDKGKGKYGRDTEIGSSSGVGSTAAVNVNASSGAPLPAPIEVRLPDVELFAPLNDLSNDYNEALQFVAATSPTLDSMSPTSPTLLASPTSAAGPTSPRSPTDDLALAMHRPRVHHHTRQSSIGTGIGTGTAQHEVSDSSIASNPPTSDFVLPLARRRRSSSGGGTQAELAAAVAALAARSTGGAGRPSVISTTTVTSGGIPATDELHLAGTLTPALEQPPPPPRLKRTYSQLNPKERASFDFLSNISLGLPSKEGIDLDALKALKTAEEAAQFADETESLLPARERNEEALSSAPTSAPRKRAREKGVSSSSLRSRFRHREDALSSLGLATAATFDNNNPPPSSNSTTTAIPSDMVAAASIPMALAGADAIPPSLKSRLGASFPTSPAISRLRNEAAAFSKTISGQTGSSSSSSLEKQGSVTSLPAGVGVGTLGPGRPPSSVGSTSAASMDSVRTTGNLGAANASAPILGAASTPLAYSAPSHITIAVPPFSFAETNGATSTNKATRQSSMAQRLGFKGLWRTLSMLATRTAPPQDLEMGVRTVEPAPSAVFPSADEVSDPHTPYYHRPITNDSSEPEILIVPGRSLKEETHAGVVGEITQGKPVWTLTPTGSPIAVSSISRWVPRGDGAAAAGARRRRTERGESGGVNAQTPYGVGRVGRITRSAAAEQAAAALAEATATSESNSMAGTPRPRGGRVRIMVTPSTHTRGASGGLNSARPGTVASEVITPLDEDMEPGVPVIAVPPINQQGLIGVTATANGQLLFVGQSQATAPTAGSSAEAKKLKAESYVAALRSTGSLDPRPASDVPRHSAPGASSRYDPLALDDPLLKTGKHRTVMALPSYLSSIIQFAPRRELKDEINEQFRALHPEVDPTLTLSMIRTIKKKIADIAIDEQLELSSAALAYVYFEKLVSARRVAKINRKLVAAVCFLLAVKVNDSKENTDFAELLETLEEEFDVSPTMIKSVEFQTYAALDFSLFVPQDEVFPHLERILRDRGVRWEDYVAEQKEKLGGADPWFFLSERG